MEMTWVEKPSPNRKLLSYVEMYSVDVSYWGMGWKRLSCLDNNLCEWLARLVFNQFQLAAVVRGTWWHLFWGLAFGHHMKCAPDHFSVNHYPKVCLVVRCRVSSPKPKNRLWLILGWGGGVFLSFSLHKILHSLILIDGTLCVFYTMASFNVIYKYVFSEWRSIRAVEINHYDITMTTHYDIIMGNDIVRIPIMKSQWVMTLLYVHIKAPQCICYYELLLLWITMSNYVIVLWLEWNKNNNKFMFDQSEQENASVVFV